ISPAVTGKLKSVPVMPGQSVKKGEVVALLDNRQLVDQVKQSHAKVLEAIAGVNQAKTSLLLAENTNARTEILVKDGIDAVKDLVASRSQVDTDISQLFAAQAAVSNAVAAEAAAKIELTYTSVRSPIDGVVAQRYLNVSDSVDLNSPIVHVVN